MNSPCHIPSDDEWTVQGSYRFRYCLHLYGWYPHCHRTMEEHHHIIRQSYKFSNQINSSSNLRRFEFEKDELNTLVSAFNWPAHYDPIKLQVSQIGLLLQKLKMFAHSSVHRFLSRFIRNYSVHSSFNDLTQKNLPLGNGENETDAFDRLKTMFPCCTLSLFKIPTSPPPPPWMRHLKVCLWCHPLSTWSWWSLASHRLHVSIIHLKPNGNYDIMMRALAIVKALCEWWHYLYLEGVPSTWIPLTIRTSKSSTTHPSYPISKHTGLSSSHFSFTIHHISGKKAGKPMLYPLSYHIQITKIMRIVSSYHLHSLPNPNESPLHLIIPLFYNVSRIVQALWTEYCSWCPFYLGAWMMDWQMLRSVGT